MDHFEGYKQESAVPGAEGDAREAPLGAAPPAPPRLAAGLPLDSATAPVDGLAVTEIAAPLCAAAEARSAAASPALAAALPAAAAAAEGSALRNHNYAAPVIWLKIILLKK